jgi:hypothetical protein
MCQDLKDLAQLNQLGESGKSESIEQPNHVLEQHPFGQPESTTLTLDRASLAVKPAARK